MLYSLSIFILFSLVIFVTVRMTLKLCSGYKQTLTHVTQTKSDIWGRVHSFVHRSIIINVLYWSSIDFHFPFCFQSVWISLKIFLVTGFNIAIWKICFIKFLFRIKYRYQTEALFRTALPFSYRLFY